MVDPAGPLEPPRDDPPADPATVPEAAPPPAYDLPTARRVVSSGLQLALASSGDLRRASIYIGLLLLGAFGPAIIALLLIVGRLGDQAGEAMAAVFFGREFGAPSQPALEAALLVVAIEALVGVALFITISIDAQIMAISLLGGRASERPMRLWEAIIRARQVFWRMAGAGAVVGVAGGLIQALLLAAFGGLSQSSEAANVLAAIVATIIVAPLAYVSTGIVLGDVGAMEALSRSWRLYRVRRLLAVVVVLFTLVTSAIQLFALSAGLDLVIRASELLNVSLTEGALAFTTAIVLILAAVVAYGSLMFTIGAVVSAPQVTGFLGLTFYGAGLDRARRDTPKPPRGFRYVSRPMAVAMLALGGVVALEIPAINSIPQLPTSTLLGLIREEAAAESDRIEVYGYPPVVEDRAGDVAAGAPPDIDILRAEATYLEVVPPWILDEFACGEVAVACGDGSGGTTPFEHGAYLFLERASGPLVADDARRIAILLALRSEVTEFRRGGDDSYGGASRVFVTTPGAQPTIESGRSRGDAFSPQPTAARSTWGGTDFFLLIPAQEIGQGPYGWDVVTFIEDGSGATPPAIRDTLRSDWDSALRPWQGEGAIWIQDFRDLD